MLESVIPVFKLTPTGPALSSLVPTTRGSSLQGPKDILPHSHGQGHLFPGVKENGSARCLYTNRRTLA